MPRLEGAPSNTGAIALAVAVAVAAAFVGIEYVGIIDLIPSFGAPTPGAP